MKLNIVYKEPPQPSRQGAMFEAGVFTKTIVGTYGYVRSVSMKTATVSVELMNGVLLHSVRIPSRTWIDETADTVTGTVDLPPVNSYVFVLLPYGMDNLSGGIILFSAFNDRIATQEERLVEGDEKKVVDVLPGNIKTTYDRETGNYKIQDIDDDAFIIEIDKENKKIHVADWSGNDILADPDGIVITDANDNKITGSTSGLKLEDKNGNTISMEAGKVLVNTHLEVLQ